MKSISDVGHHGFRMVELDPSITVDKNWVIMHDLTVDRMTNGTGYVSDFTLQEIKNLEIKFPYSDSEEILRVPTLEEAVKECSFYGMGIMLDGQRYSTNETFLEYFIELFERYHLLQKSIFHMPTLEKRQLGSNYPEITMAVTVNVSELDNMLNEIKNYKNRMVIGFKTDNLTSEAIRRTREAGALVYAWDAYNFQQAYKWINHGISFIETDYIIPGGLY